MDGMVYQLVNFVQILLVDVISVRMQQCVIVVLMDLRLMLLVVIVSIYHQHAMTHIILTCQQVYVNHVPQQFHYVLHVFKVQFAHNA